MKAIASESRLVFTLSLSNDRSALMSSESEGGLRVGGLSHRL